MIFAETFRLRVAEGSVVARIITDYLDEACHVSPNKKAYADIGREITYRRLRSEAYAVANAVMEHGIKKSVVAIHLPKSVDCLSCMWGVLYSGNAFAVMNTSNPDIYIGNILRKLESPLIITDHNHIDQIRLYADKEDILYVDDILDGWKKKGVYDERVKWEISISPYDPCYVVFTSGSTGSPKGVYSNHAALVEAVEAWSQHYGTDEYIALNQFPLYYGAALWCDIITGVKDRALIYLLPEDIFLNPGGIVKAFRGNVTRFCWSTAAVKMLANIVKLQTDKYPQIKKIDFGGEPPTIEMVSTLKKYFPNAEIKSIYASTEGAGVLELSLEGDLEGNSMRWGYRPFENVEIIPCLLEEDVNDKLYEMYVRSPAVVSGYFNDMDLTNRVFVQNPMNKRYPDIVLKTGDLIRIQEDGAYILVGRQDFQVKIDGHIINLIELEQCAESIRDVDICGCSYMENKIYLYYEGQAKEEDLMIKLKELLPRFMIPYRIIKKNLIPRTQNGKVDRTKLTVCG